MKTPAAPPAAPAGRVAIASLVFLAMAAIAGVTRWISASAAEFVVTNRRVIRKAGLFAREIEQAPLDKIQDITVAQGVWGRLLNFGTVTLETADLNIVRSPQVLSRLALSAALVGALAPAALAAGGRHHHARSARSRATEVVLKLVRSSFFTGPYAESNRM